MTDGRTSETIDVRYEHFLFSIEIRFRTSRIQRRVHLARDARDSDRRRDDDANARGRNRDDGVGVRDEIRMSGV